MKKHPMESIGLKFIGHDICTYNGVSHLVTTVEIPVRLSSITPYDFESAIDTDPIERYTHRRDAIAGHKRYVRLLCSGWKLS